MTLTDQSFDPGFAPDPGSSGIPGFFIAFFVLVMVIAVGGVVWRIATARDLARKAGLDPDQAAAMTALSENGLEATYLAAHLRPTEPTAEANPNGRPAAERLAELESLREAGTITADEYANRRQAIIDSI